jgi:CheY-like chemotaxis protein
MPDKPKILCVDDKIDNLRIRAMMLERFGWEAVIATDRDSALRACKDGGVDLAVLDYHLANGETGEDLARDLRKINPKLPIILLTGDVNVPASAAENVNAVMIKGMGGPRALLDLIEKLLPDATSLGRPPMRVGNAEKPKLQAGPRKRVK